MHEILPNICITSEQWKITYVFELQFKTLYHDYKALDWQTPDKEYKNYDWIFNYGMTVIRINISKANHNVAPFDF